jgi:hypothetical protein
VVSLEKSASTAPALVPVASNGDCGPGDQAKAAVLGISRRRTMTGGVGVERQGETKSKKEEQEYFKQRLRGRDLGLCQSASSYRVRAE